MVEPFELEYNEEETVLPGFRFFPTDEELVTFYLRKKVQRRRFPFEIIIDIDIYKFDPWDLPKMSPMGEPKRELYFFCPRYRKYRNSTRPNRVTLSGFWKATGTDRCIYSSSGECIGLKKSLVFYQGKAVKGDKTDWMMHEFRLPAPGDSPSNCLKDADHKLQLDEKDANWTICKIFKRPQRSPGKIQPFSHGEEPKQCLAELPLFNTLATNLMLPEICCVKEDFSEEDSKSQCSSSPISTPTSSSPSLYAYASPNPPSGAWTPDELAIASSFNPVQSESSTPPTLQQRSSMKLHISTNTAISAGGLPLEDLWSSILSPRISPDLCFSWPYGSIFAADQAYPETQSFAQDAWTPIWGQNSGLSLPLWDQPASVFSDDHLCSL